MTGAEIVDGQGIISAFLFSCVLLTGLTSSSEIMPFFTLNKVHFYIGL